MAGVGAGDENGTMISLISAPTNLGLKPPVRGAVPGTAKAAEALREAGFTTACWPAARETAGAVLPGRYVDDEARAAGRPATGRPWWTGWVRTSTRSVRPTSDAGVGTPQRRPSRARGGDRRSRRDQPIAPPIEPITASSG